MLRRVALSVVTAFFVLVMAAGCDKEATRSDPPVLGLLEPEGYRVRIEAIEAVLYQSSPAGYGDLERVGWALLDLHEDIIEREKSPFVRSAADELLFLSARADVADAGYAVPKLDPADKTNLMRLIDQLDALIAEGRRECDLLGEPLYEPDFVGFEGDREIEAWSRFHGDWDERVTAEAQRLPPAPPFEYQWSGRFNAAMNHLDDARTALATLP